MNLDLLILYGLDVPMENHVSPPFGRICVELFSKHQNKQIQEGGVFFSTTQVVVKGHYLPRHAKGEI